LHKFYLACDRESEELLAPRRKDAKFGINVFPLRLGVFARDIPNFGCGFGAPGPS
jgi:hypothetical protein